MHIYEKPYYAALSEFVEKYLVLGLATVFSMLSIAILLKVNNYNDAFNVYFFVSIITIVFAIPYWYWMGFKRIKNFRTEKLGHKIPHIYKLYSKHADTS